jgi:hypothetical protein
MIQLVIGGLLLGAVLGLRLKVIVLLPVTIMGAAITSLAALLMGQSGTVVISSVASFGLALQGGYLLGSWSRFTIAAARAARSVPARGSFKASR